jgi:hypothetical protein
LNHPAIGDGAIGEEIRSILLRAHPDFSQRHDRAQAEDCGAAKGKDSGTRNHHNFDNTSNMDAFHACMPMRGPTLS